MENNGIKRFISCHIPVYLCNFRCSYCYVGQHQGAFKHGIKPLIQKPEDISAFFSVERTGGICYFNLCGAGETLLHPQIVDLVSCLTKEGHFCDIITNGTPTEKIDSLISELDTQQKERLFIKFSFHYEQLLQKALLNRFIDNVKRIEAAHISYTIEITPDDDLIPYIDEIKALLLNHFGAFPHITVTRNEASKEIKLLTSLSKEEYKGVWETFDSQLFDFKYSIFGNKRSEFCYAGEWSLYVNLLTGVYQQCYGGDVLGNIKNIREPIRFRAIGRCRQPHCWNGHAFLALGDIPELCAPLYSEERDRITSEGHHWLQSRVRLFFGTRLQNSNSSFSDSKKKYILMCNYIFWLPRHIKIIANYIMKRIKEE